MELQTEPSLEESAQGSPDQSPDQHLESAQESLDLGLEAPSQESLDSDPSEEAPVQEDEAASLEEKEAPEVEVIQEPSDSEAQEQLKKEIEKDLPDPDQVFKPLDDETVNSWSTLEDINLDEIPKQMHAPLERVVGIAQEIVSEYHAETERKRSEYELARRQLLELTEGIQEEGVNGQAVVKKFEEQGELLSALNDDIVSTAWRGFNIMRPDYDNLPQEVKTAFSDFAFGPEEGGRGMLHTMPGDTLIDKLNAVLDFTLYRTGYTGSVTPDAPSPDSTNQALVNGGEVASAVPVRSVDEMNYKEIMSRYEHLLTE